MTDLTRRNAVKLLAGGSLFASGSALGAASSTTGSPLAPADFAVLPAAARACATSAPPPATSPVLLARVFRCRSWDGSVYLATPSASGYAQLAPHAFAIAAACQAAGRPLAMRHAGHDPRWSQGSGLFHGVVVAIDPEDLEPQGAPWA